MVFCCSATLSPSTAELVARYAQFADDGLIEKFHIINEEVIVALREAACVAQANFVSNESLSDHWAAKSPCEDCDQRRRCSITCRLKHNYEKSVFGELLCGRLPAIEKQCGEEKNNVYFNAYFRSPNRLDFYRSEGHDLGMIVMGKNGEVFIDSVRVVLRPWSEALYRLFMAHPEGVALAAIATTHKREFLRLYYGATKSDVKLSKTKALLKDKDKFVHAINNKIAELNSQLRAAGVMERFMVLPDKRKSNLKPYFIHYLSEVILDEAKQDAV